MRRLLLVVLALLSALALVAAGTAEDKDVIANGGSDIKVKRTHKHETGLAPPKRETRESRPQPSPDELRNHNQDSRRGGNNSSGRAPGKSHPGLATTYTLTPPSGDRSLRMRALVIAADGSEPSLDGITGSLDQVGVPYDVLLAVPTALTPSILVNAQGAGNYYAIFLATANLSYFDGSDWLSAFEPEEWDLLAQYQLIYRVREVDYYTYPTAEFGLGVPTAVGTDVTPVTGQLTAAGRTVFPYLAGDVPVKGAWTYLAPATDPGTVPLVTGPDDAALVSLRTFTDGREGIVVTMDGQAYFTHSIILGYGIIDWATRGIFLGERAAYFVPQVDDFFYPDGLWDPATETTIEDPSYRADVTDLSAYVAWQERVQRQDPRFRGIISHMVFNGDGADYANDPLTKAAMGHSAKFRWVNHTWDHANMDAMTYNEAKAELSKNNTVATNLGMPAYTRTSLVTPDISGLSSANAVKAMLDTGVRYTVGDTSRPDLNNPRFNVGRPNVKDARLYIVPRYPTNIFYNVTNPEELVSEYNFIHRAYWGRDLTYPEILDVESDMLASYMLTHNINPIMFHQSNIRAYDEARTRSLLSDITDETLAKYARYYNLPVRSPTETELGQRMQERGSWTAANIDARVINWRTITLRSPVATRAPVTGGAFRTSVDYYGTETISWVNLKANTTVTIKLPAAL